MGTSGGSGSSFCGTSHRGYPCMGGCECGWNGIGCGLCCVSFSQSGGSGRSGCG